MHLTTPLVTLLLLALSLASPSSASPSRSGKPQDKFVKRTHHASHHGGGGIFGNSGGSMLKTVAGGTALAAGAGFAGTAGGMAAHHLFEGHHDQEEGRGERAVGREVPVQTIEAERAAGGYPAIRNVVPGGSGEAVYPVAMLMSDGSYRAIPGDAGGVGTQPVVQPPLYSNPVGVGQDRSQTSAGAGAAGRPFVFPPEN